MLFLIAVESFFIVLAEANASFDSVITIEVVVTSLLILLQ
jgi:hypothetical protein